MEAPGYSWAVGCIVVGILLIVLANTVNKLKDDNGARIGMSIGGGIMIVIGIGLGWLKWKANNTEMAFGAAVGMGGWALNSLQPPSQYVSPPTLAPQQPYVPPPQPPSVQYNQPVENPGPQYTSGQSSSIDEVVATYGAQPEQQPPEQQPEQPNQQPEFTYIDPNELSTEVKNAADSGRPISISRETKEEEENKPTLDRGPPSTATSQGIVSSNDFIEPPLNRTTTIRGPGSTVFKSSSERAPSGFAGGASVSGGLFV